MPKLTKTQQRKKKERSSQTAKKEKEKSSQTAISLNASDTLFDFTLNELYKKIPQHSEWNKLTYDFTCPICQKEFTTKDFNNDEKEDLPEMANMLSEFFHMEYKRQNIEQQIVNETLQITAKMAALIFQTHNRHITDESYTNETYTDFIFTLFFATKFAITNVNLLNLDINNISKDIKDVRKMILTEFTEAQKKLIERLGDIHNKIIKDS